jgi:membrane fusion protein (multidrug efflux system)
MSDSPTARASSTNSDATIAPPVPVAWRSRLAVRRFIVLLVVPLIVVLASAGVYLNGGRYVETENAYVKADKVPVSAEVSGTIKEVLVDENQPVRAGQVMFRLDPAPFQVTV